MLIEGYLSTSSKLLANYLYITYREISSLRNGVLYVLAWVAWVGACVGGVLVWIGCQHGQRRQRASVGGVVTWVTWLTCQRGGHGNKADLVGVPAWVRWLMCQRVWHTILVNRVGDIGENIGGELGSIVGGTLFLKLFPKTGRK